MPSLTYFTQYCYEVVNYSPFTDKPTDTQRALRMGLIALSCLLKRNEHTTSWSGPEGVNNLVEAKVSVLGAQEGRGTGRIWIGKREEVRVGGQDLKVQPRRNGGRFHQRNFWGAWVEEEGKTDTGEKSRLRWGRRDTQQRAVWLEPVSQLIPHQVH